MDSMSSTLSPLGQLDENLFTSPPSLRRLSTSSMATTISCATNPNSPAPRTPKSEDASSPTGFGKILFGEDDFMSRFDPDDRKSIHGNSIAPNLLINTHHDHHHHHHDAGGHGYHSHEDLLRPHQIEHIDRMLLHQPQPQLTQHSIVRCQDTITPFIDCSNYASWGPGTSPGEAAMSALQCVTEVYEGEFDISDEDSQHSSPSPVLSHLSSSRRNQIASSSPPATPARARRPRAPRRTEVDLPLIVSSSDQAHQCQVCRRRFRRPEHLRRHELTHTLEKPYECDVCGRRFSRTDNRRAHRLTHMKPGGRTQFIPGLKML